MSSTWSAEVESQAQAVPLFKATFADWHNLGPLVVPDIIAGITILSGNGNPGSTRQINFTPAVPYSFVKERLDFIDHEKLEIKITAIEGGDLGKKLESKTSHFKIEPKGNGSIVKLVMDYQVLPGVDVTDDLNKAKESLLQIVKAVEEYLLANPGTYV